MRSKRADRVFRLAPWCLITALVACCTPILARASNPIQLENAKPGTTAWQLTNPALQHEIEGYASLTSVNRGGQISLFVQTKDSSYSLDVFRMGWYGGLGGRQLLSRTALGSLQPPPILQTTNGYLVECNWTNPFVLQVTNDAADSTVWCSGVYLVKLTGSTSGKQSYIIFTVRDDGRSSDFLFQSSVTTWQAYNTWGGGCLYPHTLTLCSAQQAQKVSFNRPYERNSQFPGVEFSTGSGHFLTCLFPYTTDYCEPSLQKELSPAAWEYNMVRFLEREGYDVTYCTDVDVHENGNLLLTHKGYLSVGHDEYWSLAMRNNVEAARDKGVNLAFFSANTCYWQIRFEASTINAQADRTMVCYKNATTDPIGPTNPLVTIEWRYAPINRPENKMIGLMSDVYPAHDDMIVTNSWHWIYSGTGLKNGDHLPGLVGYEADRGFASGPPGLQIVTHSPTPESTSGQFSESCVYRASSGAFVFGAGTIQWAWGLDDYNANSTLGPALRASVLNPAVQQMTRNVLTHFTTAVPVLNWTNPAPIVYGTALGAKQLNATATVPGVFTYTPPLGSVLNAGTNQVLGVNFAPSDTNNYTSMSASVVLSVSKAPLSVTAFDVSRAFGQPNPVFSGNILGLVNSDQITASFSCSATNSSPAGNYLIIPSLVDPEGRLRNYATTVTNGVLTVMPAETCQISPSLISSLLLLSTQTQLNTQYVLEYKNAISDPEWLPLVTNLGNGGMLIFTNQLGSSSTRFYRIVLE